MEAGAASTSKKPDPDNAAEVPVADFINAGEEAARVAVEISYGIIERFSEGLYSSPNKTFEELVTNSYDAGAERVWVYLPVDLTAERASLVVLDDGQSMDLQGLQDLWRIGESKKRAERSPPPGRDRPVGKFGIGKLATYVLAEELTYITHRDGEYLAITMDYGRVSSESRELLSGVDLSLQVVRLDRVGALTAVRAALVGAAKSDAVQQVLDDDEPPHWTAAVLSRLKPKAAEIKQGMLRWVLRTALPLNPSFQLTYNDELLESSKAAGEKHWTYTIGLNEGELPTAHDKPWHGATATTIKDSEGNDRPAILLPSAGPIWGTADLFEDALERGKSEDLGRSHGYFVRVRGRLINLNAADFSVGPELRHGTLTRFRMEVNADGLDEQVASARESLKESRQLDELKEYMLAVFNRARAVLTEKDAEDHMPLLANGGRLSDPSPALSQGPLRRMVARAVAGDRFVQTALSLSDEDLEVAGEVLEAGEDFIESITLDDLGMDKRLVALDPHKRSAVVNQAHPFIGNYLEGKGIVEALKLMALTELLTEAYLLDEEVLPDVVRRVMMRREAFLRALAHRHPRSAHVIAQALREASNDENRLEDAVGDALDLLGYEVLRIGGSTHGTDGVATARLGRREAGHESYALTYDAKSSGKEAISLIQTMEPPADAPSDSGVSPVRKAARIRADTARTSILRVHRERATETYRLEVVPQFTLVVAPGFQGEDDEEAHIHEVCRNDGITALTVNDLATLVELFSLQGLTPFDLRSLFECHGPSETREWIEAQKAESRVPTPPVAVLVDVLLKYSEGKQVTDVSALGAYLRAEGHDMDATQVEGLVRGLDALAPKALYFDGRVIALNASPEALFREVRETLDQYDEDLVSAYRRTIPGDDE